MLSPKKEKKTRKISLPWSKPKSLLAPEIVIAESISSHLTVNDGRPRARTYNEGEKREWTVIKDRKISDVRNYKQRTGNAIFVRTTSPDSERVHGYKTFQILLLGIPKVGKTCILERFLRDSFSEQYTPTTSETCETEIFLEIDNKLKQFDLIFHDFRGDLKTHHTTLYKEEIGTSDGFMLVHTKNELESFPTVLEMVADIKKIKKKGAAGCSILVMENKCDELCYFGDMRVTRRSFDMEGCINVAVSSKQNKNISEAIAQLVEDIESSSMTKLLTNVDE